MWAVGHLALGYLTGKGAAKVLKENINVPLLFLTSIILDVDILIPTLAHRGPTHSLVLSLMALVPCYLIFGRKVIIYFLSICSHSLLGDLFFTGRAQDVQIFWPLTLKGYSGLSIPMGYDVPLEWLFFVLSMGVMVCVRDLEKMFEPHPINLILTIPVLTIIMPVFLGFPPGVPSDLFIPHLVYLAIISFSILTDLKLFVTR